MTPESQTRNGRIAQLDIGRYREINTAEHLTAFPLGQPVVFYQGSRTLVGLLAESALEESEAETSMIALLYPDSRAIVSKDGDCFSEYTLFPKDEGFLVQKRKVGANDVGYSRYRAMYEEARKLREAGEARR